MLKKIILYIVVLFSVGLACFIWGWKSHEVNVDNHLADSLKTANSILYEKYVQDSINYAGTLKSYFDLETKYRLLFNLIPYKTGKESYKAVESMLTPAQGEKLYCLDSVQIKDNEYKLTDRLRLIDLNVNLLQQTSSLKSMNLNLKESLNNSNGIIKLKENEILELKDKSKVANFGFVIRPAVHYNNSVKGFREYLKARVYFGGDVGLRYKSTNLLFHYDTKDLDRFEIKAELNLLK